MSDINQVVLVGRLTKDPEYKQVGSSAVANFSIANGRVTVVDGQKKEETSFFDCEAWGKLAEIVKQYVNKGRQIAVTGRLKQQSWETPDGKKASKIKIQVETLQMLGSNGNNPKSDNHDGAADAEQDQSPEDIF